MLDVEKLIANVHEYVERAVKPLADEIAELKARQPERGEKGDPGEAGQDAPPVEVSEVVKELLATDAVQHIVGLEVASYLQENPPAAGKDGPQGDKGDPGKDGEKGADGSDGAGIADLLIDRDGALVATMTDGRTKSLGVVVGRDGAKGADGKDGADFTDCDLDWDGERTLFIRSKGAEIRKTLSVPIDRGYWREGMACEKADVVTYDGNAWAALRDTKAKPCHENKDDWRLFARKGRDGRDGSDGKPPPGPVKLGGNDGA